METREGLVRDIAGIHRRMRRSPRPRSQDFILKNQLAFLIVLFAMAIRTEMGSRSATIPPRNHGATAALPGSVK